MTDHGAPDNVDILIAEPAHQRFVDIILLTIKEAAKKRGTGIAERSADYVAQKIKERKAILALQQDEFAGFTYIESWGNKQYVATSGLIVPENFQGQGIAWRIKQASFALARQRWPHAKLFSLTSGGAVMKMNSRLGYRPVPFDELTDDEAFWRGCQGCVNHDVLLRTHRRYCICTAMLFDPAEHPSPSPPESPPPPPPLTVIPAKAGIPPGIARIP
jgi:hypothetical protein